MLEPSQTRRSPSKNAGADAEPDELRSLRAQLEDRTRQLEALESGWLDAVERTRRQAELLALASHDLRSPLCAILGYADLIEMGVPGDVPAAAREYVRRIRTSAQQVQVLLDRLIQPE